MIGRSREDSNRERGEHRVGIPAPDRGMGRGTLLVVSVGADGAAMQIINEDPAADQNTADLVMQVGAYGRVVFG